MENVTVQAFVYLFIISSVGEKIRADEDKSDHR